MERDIVYILAVLNLTIAFHLIYFNGAYSNNGVVHRALLHRGYENVHRGTIETATAVGTGM